MNLTANFDSCDTLLVHLHVVLCGMAWFEERRQYDGTLCNELNIIM